MTSAIIAATLALIAFVITQSILKFIIEPIQEQRKLIGEVANALVVYANVFIDEALKKVLEQEDRFEAEMEKVVETQKTLRVFSGRLLSTLWSIPFYGIFSLLGLVPKATDVVDASTQFIGWSNSLVGSNASDRVSRRRDIISEKLGIERKLNKLRDK